MRLKKIFRRLSILSILLGIWVLTSMEHAPKSDYSSQTESRHTTQAQFLQSPSNQIWYATTAENTSYTLSNHEHSGGEMLFTTLSSISLKYRPSTIFDHPAFNTQDRRKLILQYLYPFHFFF